MPDDDALDQDPTAEEEVTGFAAPLSGLGLSPITIPGLPSEDSNAYVLGTDIPPGTDGMGGISMVRKRPQ